MDRANDQVLRIAEDVISHLPGNIQTKYYMLKSLIVRKATEELRQEQPQPTPKQEEKSTQTVQEETDTKVKTSGLDDDGSSRSPVQRLDAAELTVRPSQAEQQSAGTQTGPDPAEEERARQSQFYRHQIAQLNKVHEQLHQQNSQLIQKVQEQTRAIEARSKDVAELRGNQKLIKQILAGLINKMARVPMPELERKNISELLSCFNDHVNAFQDDIYQGQQRIDRQNKENAELILTLKRKIDQLETLNRENSAFQQDARGASIQCLQQLKAKSEQQIQHLQGKLADMFQQLSRFRRHESYSEDVGSIFESLSAHE